MHGALFSVAEVQPVLILMKRNRFLFVSGSVSQTTHSITMASTEGLVGIPPVGAPSCGGDDKEKRREDGVDFCGCCQYCSL